jgi:hydroxymethylglutaryl-CoA lyase
MMKKPKIHEVGPRDGLQVEKTPVPLAEKIRWIEGVLASGVDLVQLGSFVNPEKVPQMADTDALFAHFRRPGAKPEGVTLSALVLNERGLERGRAAGVELLCMGVSASETHSRRNTGMGTEEALRRIVAMARGALRDGVAVQASVQSAFGCGFEGPIPPGRVLDLVKAYLEAGVRNISLADTAGHAHPPQVRELFGAIRQLDAEVELACHFHNTYGLGLANCLAALECGVSTLETAFGGLGGCPFTKLPAGNVCTEDLVHTLQRMGMRGDVDLERLIQVSRDVAAFFGRELPGLVARAGSIVGFTGARG